MRAASLVQGGFSLYKYTYNSGDKKPNRFFEKLNAMLRGDAPENERLMKYAESATNKERLGAEFPFIRYFREYHEPTDTDTLLTQFLEANALVQSDSIATLDAFRGTTEKLQDSGIQWVGEIPISWNTKKIKYMAKIDGWRAVEMN